MALRSFNTNGETKVTKWREAHANETLGITMEFQSEGEGGLPELLTLEGATELQIQQQQNKPESLLCGVVNMLLSPGTKQCESVPAPQDRLCQPSTTGILVWIILCCGAVWLQNNSTKCQQCLPFSNCDGNFFRHCYNPSEELNCPQFRTSALRSWKTSVGASKRNGIHATSSYTNTGTNKH